MKYDVIAALLALAVILGGGIGYFAVYSGQHTTTVVSTITVTTSVQKTDIALTQTSTDCTVSAEGSGFFVTVETDSGSPVAGAQVSGSRVTEYGGGTCEQSIGSQYTNASGTVLITDNMGSYNALTVLYQGKYYTLSAQIAPMETTYVTLRVPSGNFSVGEVFEGGCSQTASGVTCPG